MEQIWASSTSGSGNYLIMQPTDGNLVVYSSGGTALWALSYQGVATQAGSYVLFPAGYDDGFTVDNPYNAALWSSEEDPEVACNPGRNTPSQGPEHDGIGVTASGGSAILGGVWGNILVENPYLDPAGQGGNTTSAWVLLMNDNDSNSYVQMGWQKRPDGLVDNWAEAYGGNIPAGQIWDRYYGAAQPGSSNEYEVLTTGNGNFTLWLNGTYVDQVDQGLVIQNEGVAASEIHDWNDAFPGGITDPESFTNLGIWYPAGQPAAERRSRLWDRQLC